MQQTDKIYRIIISGGGTGGHIFPAIAIANTLKDNLRNPDILFVGAKGKMEMEKVPAAGYPIKALWISGLQRKLSRRNILFPLKLIYSIAKALQIVRKFKPHLVIGTGGFASGPTLQAAAMLKVPVLIQEQNSYPGITNRLLGRKADVICVAYSGLEKYFPAAKILLTGNPVRKETISIEGKRNEALNFFDLHGESKLILVIGGSLGAGTINQSIEKNLELFAEKGYKLVWQTGKAYKPQAERAIKEFPSANFRVYDFITAMDMAYAAADVIVSRAGAIAISELCCIGKAVIMIPSPNVAEDHQTHNAMALVNANAAIMIKDSEAKDKLGESLINLLENEDEAAKLSENILSLATPGAAQSIANAAVNLLQKNIGK